jgi:hypothetical protein
MESRFQENLKSGVNFSSQALPCYPQTRCGVRQLVCGAKPPSDGRLVRLMGQAKFTLVTRIRCQIFGGPSPKFILHLSYSNLALRWCKLEFASLGQLRYEQAYSREEANSERDW